jgi:hypothetical protein
MKKTIIYLSLTFLLAGLYAFAQKSNNDEKYVLEHLSGTYADAKPYNYGKAFGKRVFTFNKGKWSLIFTLSLDAEMKVPVFTFRTFGKYQLQEKSSTVADTYNAVFFEEKKFVTLKTSDENLIKAFGFTSCGLTPNVEQDISITGCSAWLPVKECPADYDLLSLDKDGKLYFGQRPADNNMCSQDKRPTQLTPPVIKIKK